MNIAANPSYMQTLFVRLGFSLAILAGLCAVPNHAVTAASCPTEVIVTSNADSGADTLRQAIADVCAGGTITFDRALSGGTITLTSGVLNIAKNMTIDGSTLTDQITISGGGISGIFHNTQSLTLKSLKIVNGVNDFGGGIQNRGSLAVTNCTFSGNSASNGGAILTTGGSTATVTNSTFSGNTAFYGGAIYNIGTLVVRNSTFSGNSVSDVGSGIYNVKILTIENSTFYGNSGSVALFNDNITTISNTILAGTGGTGVDCENSGYITSASKNNLIQKNSECFTSAPVSGKDPLLGPLADNGGPTRTFALLTGSPAINAGDYATCLSAVDGKDQRSSTREDASGQCDIGAYEAGTYLLPEVSSTVPAHWDVLKTSPSSLTVVFNKDVDSDSATNPVNYLLASPGTDGAFQTSECRTGLAGDDKQIAVNSVAYDSDTFTAVLTVNDGHALSNGDYELWVCGTTSIIDSASTKLNNGTDDTRIDFTVNAAAGGGTGGGSTNADAKLPATGFAPGRVTSLPVQSAGYSGLNLTLEIPAIHVKAPVVGVPQNKNGWDVTWLGHDAGWLNGSAFPTWGGNSIITGHVWDADNLPGLFADLKTLKYGDSVLIHAFGEVYTYEVRDSRLVKPGGINQAIDHENKPWITLVTCEDFAAGTGDYIHRRLVSAVLMNVTSEK